MAVVLVDGFDLYNGVGANTGLQARWTLNDGGSAFDATMVGGRYGGQAVQLNHTSGAASAIGYIQRTLAASTASFTVACAMNFTVFPSTDNTIHFITLLDSALGFQLGFRITSTGQIEARRATSASAGTILGTSAVNVVLANTWHFFEISGTINDTTGTITFKIDGATVLNLTSQDTKNTTLTDIQTVRFGQATNALNAMTVLIDDLYILDSATSLGQRKVETIYPTSDVAQGFARSSGSTNYTLVDEAQVNGDTDYVQGSTVGDVDTYGLTDLATTPTAISAVQVNAFALKTDAGSRSIALQVKSGATTSDGSNYALAGSYAKYERILETDPNTSAAWTGSGVNALQGGPKVTV